MANLSGRVKDLKKSFTDRIESKNNPIIKDRI
jgi:hypothetical protein